MTNTPTDARDALARPRLIRAVDVAETLIEPIFEGSPRLIKSRVITHLDDLDRLLSEARAAAHELVADAEAHAGAIRERARREGISQAESEVLDTLADAHQVLSAAIAGARGELLTLALAISKRIVGASVAMDPDILEQIVCDVVKRARDQRVVQILLHPDDAVIMERRAGALSRALGGAHVQIEAHDGLERGGCLLETSAGTIDARLEVRLDALRVAMEEGVPDA